MRFLSSSRRGSALRENLEALCVALLAVLFIRTFIVQAFKIPSGSMLPTLQIGDYILVSKFAYGVKLPCTGKTLISGADPRPGDIIVFRYPKNPKVDYIKRVIAVAGDVVEIRDKKLLINKKSVPDPHATFKDPIIHPESLDLRDNFGPVTVPANSLFVMGDNRDNSHDSRFWGFVPVNAVKGKAWRLYWSWDINQPFFSWTRILSIRWRRIGRAVVDSGAPPTTFRPGAPPPSATFTPNPGSTPAVGFTDLLP